MIMIIECRFEVLIDYNLVSCKVGSGLRTNGCVLIVGLFRYQILGFCVLIQRIIYVWVWDHMLFLFFLYSPLLYFICHWVFIAPLKLCTRHLWFSLWTNSNNVSGQCSSSRGTLNPSTTKLCSGESTVEPGGRRFLGSSGTF